MPRRVHVAAALLVVGAMTACEDPPKENVSYAVPASAAGPDPKVPPVPQMIEAYAIVEVGAELYAHPSEPASATIPSPPAGDSSPGVSVLVVGEVDDKLEIQTAVDILALPGEVCGGRLSGISHFNLRMYVDRDRLVHLTTERVEHEFEDGTSVKLIAGIPLLGSDPASRKLVAAGTAITIPVPAEKLGEMYWPASEGVRFFPSEGELLGAKPLRYAKGTTLAHEKLFHNYDEQLLYYAQTSKDKDVLVTVRNPCLEAVVRTSPDQIAKAPRGDRGRGERATASAAAVAATTGDKAYKVAQRVQVLWSDGEVAGSVVDDHVFEGEPKTVGDTLCWQVPVVRQAKPTLTLCFAQADLRDARDQ